MIIYSHCCCGSRLFLPAWCTYRFYMLAGAAIFSSLERPVDKLSREHNISCEDLKSLLRHYEEARMAGIPDRTRQSPLGHPRCLLLVGTVVSTIGFGVSAPSTITGKVLLVFYGLLGCSASILFFNLFLERVITFLSFLILWWHRRKAQHSTLEGRRNENDSNEERKPSVYQVTLVLFVAVLVIACGAASVYSAMEGWTYLESLYFCFVAFSTVGFGDFVSGQREHHEDTHAYKIANCLLMLLGVCCTYSLFSAISVIIKQGLTWMLKTLSWMYSSMKQYRLQIRPLFKFCQEDCLHRQNVQTVPSSDHNLLWRSCVPNVVTKCLCNEAKVETVCHRHLDSVSGRPTPEWLN
uniref:Si:ch211-261a10.5 n=1 Tax=Sphaeramia orbicularis TaxID=375764 RepID=A0A673B1S9_9TELE